METKIKKGQKFTIEVDATNTATNTPTNLELYSIVLVFKQNSKRPSTIKFDNTSSNFHYIDYTQGKFKFDIDTSELFGTGLYTYHIEYMLDGSKEYSDRGVLYIGDGTVYDYK